MTVLTAAADAHLGRNCPPYNTQNKINDRQIIYKNLTIELDLDLMYEIFETARYIVALVE